MSISLRVVRVGGVWYFWQVVDVERTIKSTTRSLPVAVRDTYVQEPREFPGMLGQGPCCYKRRYRQTWLTFNVAFSQEFDDKHHECQSNEVWWFWHSCLCGSNRVRRWRRMCGCDLLKAHWIMKELPPKPRQRCRYELLSERGTFKSIFPCSRCIDRSCHSRPMTTAPVRNRPSKRTLRILRLIDGSIFHWSTTRQNVCAVLGVGFTMGRMVFLSITRSISR